MKVILINWWMIWKRMMLSISTTKFLIAELAVADYNFHRWTSKPTEYYSVNSKPTCKPPELHTIMKKCNGTGMVLKICETKNNVWKRHILSIQNSIDNHIKTTRIKPNFASLNKEIFCTDYFIWQVVYRIACHSLNLHVIVINYCHSWSTYKYKMRFSKEY